MSRLEIALYRLPIPTASRIGHARVVLDRNGKVYINGSRVEEQHESGPFLILTAGDGQTYYVKTADYVGLRKKGT
jgi:hypothetical protein